MNLVGVLAGIFLLFALYCSLDPFKHSPISGFPDFEAHKVDFPPWSTFPVVKDEHNLLQKAEIKFLSEVQGLESIVFNPLGTGPYTRVADGRVISWNGESWSDFGHNLLQKAEIKFLNEVQGPESIVFNPLGTWPYTRFADGRVISWNGESWSDFAYTSPNRLEQCNPQPSPLAYLKNEHICGRPLGLRFDKKTGELYIADVYFGLLKEEFLSSKI